jgi:hypothetical protein
MTDVLTIARERKDELRQEIAELDEFIRVAEKLLRLETPNADDRREPHKERAGSVAAPQDEPDGDAEESRDDAEVAEVAEAESESEDGEPAVRKFPWTGMQPAVRRTGNDDSYPRRNVFRRDMSAAG